MTNQETTQCQICERIIQVLRQETGIEMISLGGPEVLQPAEDCHRHQELITSALSLTAQELSNIHQFVDVVKIHRNPLTMSAIIDGRPPAVQNSYPRYGIYLVKQQGDPDELVGGRTLDPHWIDRELPYQWKSNCDNLHRGLCRGPLPGSFSSIRPIWLVDVTNLCLVAAPSDCSYVALSYVWGEILSLQANNSNLRSLLEVGSLGNKCGRTRIAKTIWDALGVVTLLGERYLWVDALCIIQDDERTKHTELAKMSAIYANASLTICAIQGENADSGLRGFRDFSEPRKLPQTVHYLNRGVKVIRSPLNPRTLELRTGESSWEGRGWTYQEEFFSRRRLIFDSDTIRWECTAAIWREHVEPSPHIHAYHNEVTRFQTLLQPSAPDFLSLENVLRIYNNRLFTYPEDALNAFAGISYLCSPAFAGGFVSGLPVASFDIALLWQPASTKFRRRTAKHQNANHCLPSWSWAGWSGPVSMDSISASDFLRKSPAGIVDAPDRYIIRNRVWKYYETTGLAGKPIVPTILDSKDAWLNAGADLPRGWTRHAILEMSQTEAWPPCLQRRSPHYYKYEAYPDHEFWYPIPMLSIHDAVPGILASLLSTSTRRAWLSPEKEIVEFKRDRPLLLLKDQVGSWAGVLFPDGAVEGLDEALKSSAKGIELMEIAEGLCKDIPNHWPGIPEYYDQERPRLGEWYQYFWVWWIGWNHGLAHRKGIGRVCKKVWVKERGPAFDLLVN